MPSKMAANKGSASSPPEPGSNSRLQRNLAEKQRRDKMNGFISELATIVPFVAMASKRLDKTSILRLSAAHLRMFQRFLGGRKKKKFFKWCPTYFTDDQIEEIFQAVEGFVLLVESSGKIIFVSMSVEKFLGHHFCDMMGHSIFSFIHPADVEEVKAHLEATAVEASQKSSQSCRCSFSCRLRERSQPRSEVLTYQYVHVSGTMVHVKPSEHQHHTSVNGTSSSSSDFVLKSFISVANTNPYNELSLADAIEDEYVTRHDPKGTIVFADHRLSTITGHLPHEVLGVNAYEYIVLEDIPIALFAHKLMFANAEKTGLIVYRLRTRNGGFVYLKSTGHVIYHKTLETVDHFICVNRQLSIEEGKEELKLFSERFSPHIKDIDKSPKAIRETIKNLEDSNSPKPVSSPETMKSESDSQSSELASMSVGDPSNDELVARVKVKLEDQGIIFNGCSHDLVAMEEGKECSPEMIDQFAAAPPTQVLLNYSSVKAESGGSISPHSEENSIISQMDLGIESITTMSFQETSSSSELPTCHLNQDKFDELVDQDKLLCSTSVINASPFTLLNSSMHTETSSLFLSDDTSPSLTIMDADTIAPHTFWVESPCSAGSIGEHVAIIPTPPYSSSEENCKINDSPSSC